MSTGAQHYARWGLLTYLYVVQFTNPSQDAMKRRKINKIRKKWTYAYSKCTQKYNNTTNEGFVLHLQVGKKQTAREEHEQEKDLSPWRRWPRSTTAACRRCGPHHMMDKTKLNELVVASVFLLKLIRFVWWAVSVDIILYISSTWSHEQGMG